MLCYHIHLPYFWYTITWYYERQYFIASLPSQSWALFQLYTLFHLSCLWYTIFKLFSIWNTQTIFHLLLHLIYKLFTFLIFYMHIRHFHLSCSWYAVALDTIFIFLSSILVLIIDLPTTFNLSWFSYTKNSSLASEIQRFHLLLHHRYNVFTFLHLIYNKVHLFLASGAQCILLPLETQFLTFLALDMS